MKRIWIINGPNLNMLGIREPHLYGTTTYQELVDFLKKTARKEKIAIRILQSNEEGKLITWIQRAYRKKINGIIINPGAYTHTSYAIYDAIKAVSIPTVEVHLTNISTREDFRKHSVISSACVKTIMGLGMEGYQQAIYYLIGEENV